MKKKQILEFSPSELRDMIESQRSLKPNERIEKVEAFNYPHHLRIILSIEEDDSSQ